MLPSHEVNTVPKIGFSPAAGSIKANKISVLAQRTCVMGDILDLNFSSSVASNVI